MAIQIGLHSLQGQVVLAPMAGVTDRPFRQLCRKYGAALAASEMVTSDLTLWKTRKSQLRMNHEGEDSPIVVQIAGSDPKMMSDAAKLNVDLGAHIIDINMGCPAKKVCKKAAGSSLLKDESLVASILESVVNAVEVPVTLKIRTGWSPEKRNGTRIARIAEDLGIKALAVHGRTRECKYHAPVEYDTIAEITQAVAIPVFANGDILSPAKAKFVIDYTKAAGIMIGRAAQGKPWIFGQIQHYLSTGDMLEEPSLEEIQLIVLNHLDQLYSFYGETMGIRIARKHVAWYTDRLEPGSLFRKRFNKLETIKEQRTAVQTHFEQLCEDEVKVA